MDPEHANTIPISEILGKLEVKTLRQQGAMVYYPSLWDHKRGAMLVVNTATNRWSDRSTQSSTLMEWVMYYLRFRGEAHTEVDALRWLTNMSARFPETVVAPSEKQPKIELRHKKMIHYPGLLHYLEREGIALTLARQYLKEIHARNRQTGKDFIALGLPTVEGGFALRTAYLERFISQPAISFLRGRVPKPRGIHLFKEGLDYLAFLSHGQRTALEEDVIILNAWSCLPQIAPYIRQYGYQTLYSWLDNTPIGEQAQISLSRFIDTEAGLKHKPMNAHYQAHDTVHNWYRQTG